MEPQQSQRAVPQRAGYVVRFAHALAARYRAMVLSALWLFIGVLACLHAWTAYGDPFRDARLQRTGARTQGPVKDIQKQVRPDGTPEWRIEYEFLDVHGLKRTGSARLSSADAVHQLERTSTATIAYLKSDPATNTIDGQRISTLSEDQGEVYVLGTAAAVLPLIYAVVRSLFGAL